MPSTPVPSRTIKVAPLRCEFCDATTEIEFLRHHLPMTQAQLRVTFLFCALFYLCFAFSDLIWVGYQLTTCLLVAARVAVAAIGLACLALLKRRPESIPVSRLAATIVEVAGAAGFLLIAALRPTEFSLPRSRCRLSSSSFTSTSQIA
jgi:hypothetical protein